MKVAVAGSRGLFADISRYIPAACTQIITGGAEGIDACAMSYAKRSGIPLTVIRPDYLTHGRKAPILRNIDIINASDLVLIFWDKKSRGTHFVIEKCAELGKPAALYVAEPGGYRRIEPPFSDQQV